MRQAQGWSEGDCAGALLWKVGHGQFQILLLTQLQPMSDFDQLPFVAQPMLRQSWSQAETTLGGFLNKN